MPEVKRPRRGSLAFYPRKRARRIYPAISTYPEEEKLRVMGFAGYKAGMLQVIVIDNKKGSPTFGQEIVIPATVLDCPPLRVVGVRVYEETLKGLRAITEVWAENLPKDLERKVKMKPKKNFEEIEKNLERISKVRLIVSTQPRLSGLKKKKPEIFEIEIGGRDLKEKIEYTKKILGKEIYVKDVFKAGEVVDVISITKGKGTEGPVKRFGVKIQVRKAHGYRRHVGSLGQERPGKVRWTVPQAGQLGFQRRTEFNKVIIKIGENGEEITPKGGFKNYGVVSSNWVLIEGSIPGPKKRLVFMRLGIRSKRKMVLREVRDIVKV